MLFCCGFFFDCSVFKFVSCVVLCSVRCLRAVVLRFVAIDILGSLFCIFSFFPTVQKASYYIKPTSDHLAEALRVTCDRAALFVGDPMLSRGVRYPEAYADVIREFQAALRALNVPVVSTVPGVVIADDGIHWSLLSRDAVHALAGVLVDSAALASSFIESSPPFLWHWKWFPPSKVHYVVCTVCDNVIDHAHLNCPRHVANMGGSTISFKFPHDTKYLHKGFQFYRQSADGEPELVTTAKLPANQPLKSKPTLRPAMRGLATVERVTISLGTGIRELGRGKEQLPEDFHCTAEWSNGSKTEHRFVYLHQGANRMVYYDPDKPWVVKVHFVQESGSNQNQVEFLRSMQDSPLDDLTPLTRGYAEHPFRDRVISLLFVDRIGFSFSTLLRKQLRWDVNADSLSLVVVAMQTVVREMLKCIRSGWQPYDWHVDNIGFQDDSEASVRILRLVDWYGNDPSGAVDWYSKRFDKAIGAFASKFDSCIQYGVKCHPKRRAGWFAALGAVKKAMLDWWHCYQALTTESMQLPGDDDLSALSTILQTIVEDACSFSREREDVVPTTPPVTFARTETFHAPTSVPVVESNVTLDTSLAPTTDAGTTLAPTTLASPATEGSPMTKLAPTTLEFSADAVVSDRLVEEWPEAIVAGQQNIANLTSNLGKGVREVNIGEDAATSLLAASIGQRRANFAKRFKQERPEVFPTTDGGLTGNMPLDERLLAGAFRNDNDRARGRPPRESVEGDRLRTLFQILLDKLAQFDYIKRMKVPVKKSMDANEFHRAYWIKFMKRARVPLWVQMNAQQRRRHLWDWMFLKFTIDKSNRRMVPRGWPDDKRGVKRKPDGQVTNEACWDGFWLDDVELEKLVDEVCRLYEIVHGST